MQAVMLFISEARVYGPCCLVNVARCSSTIYYDISEWHGEYDEEQESRLYFLNRAVSLKWNPDMVWAVKTVRDIPCSQALFNPKQAKNLKAALHPF